MRKLFLTAFVALSSVFMPAAAQMAAPTLYGNLIYTRSWGAEDATEAGVYSFTADNSGGVVLEYRPESTNIYGNGGAVYVDGKYYVLTHVPNTGKIQKNTLYTYDATTWELLGQQDAPLTTSANDLTWCPVDNKVYGVFLNGTSSGYVFGTLNLTDGTVDAIKAIELTDNLGPMPVLALAADTAGDIYGVAADGNLYTFDRATGDCTLVGDTGFRPARWNQSGCFDFTTKEMYWAACNADVAALFKIDTATGKATNVRTFSDDEEFVGLYSASGIADINGPQAVGDFAVSLEGPALEGVVSFTLPTVSISGASLSGNVSYIVEDNGEQLLEGSGVPGTSVSRNVVLTEGRHALVAYASTSAGRGASSRLTVYAGNDVPAAPASVSATFDGEKVSVSWSAVTSGANRGYIDPTAVTYTVRRMPGGKVVADGLTVTSCTDTELPGLLGDYTYEVSAVFSGKTGVAAASEPLTLGVCLEAPVALDLTKEDQFKFCTVIDANNDSKTWAWSVNGVMCSYSRDLASDDWLITPSVNMKAGHEYTITLEMRSGNNRYAETFEVMAGTSPSAEALTVPVLENGSVMNTTRSPQTVIFTPESDGAYCLGIHCTSPKYQYSLYVYTVSISEPVSKKAPAAPTEVSVIAGTAGALEANVTAVAPSKAVDGTAIASLEKAEVLNLTTGQLVETVQSPAPGEKISATDKSAANGTNVYSVVFYNAAGKGYAATAEAYVGEDVPLAVTDVVLKQVGDAAVLSWSAPVEGVNGGYVNPANLRYRVVLTSSKADVATGLDACSYTDDKQDVATQHVLQYTVYASNVAGESTGFNSNALTFGQPYPAPFAESFAGGKTSVDPWTTVKEAGGYPEWTAATKGIYDDSDTSQDGDLGWMKYSSKGTITLQSPVIDITALANPVLKFWYRAADDTGDAVALDVLLSGDRGVSWTTAESKSVANVEWTQMSVDLSSLKGCSEVQIGFKASAQVYQDMYIDNIRVADVLRKNLGISSFSGPAILDAGSEAIYSVKVANDGSESASGYTVGIYGNDRLLASVPGVDLAPDASAVFDIAVVIPVNFAETVLEAKVDFEGDEYAANNVATLSVTAQVPRLPVIGTLAADAKDDGVHLTWDRPDEDRNPTASVDDLETLTAWDFGGVNENNASGTIGDYMVYDGDGAATVVVSSWSAQPNGTKPMAFQVNKTGDPYPAIDLKTNGVNTHSGNYSLIAWGAATGASSDWLILPELFAGETTISFWAHAAAMGWGTSPDEKLDVLYSTTGCDIADFEVFAEGVAVPAGTEYDAEKGFRFYEYTLPSDAKYAAIRVELSTGCNKAVVIDDICFTAASAPKETLEITGYNIYRDGEKIGTSDTEEYVDATASGNHVYNVTTRYHLGESAFSNDAGAVMSGIGSISLDTCGDVRFFNLQGIEVKNPSRGSVYIVVAPDGSATKQVIR